MPRDHSYYVYILAGKSRRQYVGVTNDLKARVWQHKEKTGPGHAARYNIDRLVYFEEFEEITQAIDREKQVKKWQREKKVALIERLNPTWRDLSIRWFEASLLARNEHPSLEISPLRSK